MEELCHIRQIDSSKTKLERLDGDDKYDSIRKLLSPMKSPREERKAIRNLTQVKQAKEDSGSWSRRITFGNQEESKRLESTPQTPSKNDPSDSRSNLDVLTPVLEKVSAAEELSNISKPSHKPSTFKEEKKKLEDVLSKDELESLEKSHTSKSK